jgi:type IV pilus biogenesis protein CpaD/CtpE
MTMRTFIQTVTLLAILALLSACGSSDSSSSQSAPHNSDLNENVTLRWTAPTTRSDGTYLESSDLAGYRIYMGNSSNNLSPLVDLNDSNITEYLVANLSAGSYYFAISAYDTDGQEGQLSQAVLKEAG